MKGKKFQRTYTHEIPREQPTLFNKLCVKHRKQMDKYFEQNILTYISLEDRMNWLSENRRIVKLECPGQYKEYSKWYERNLDGRKLKSKEKDFIDSLSVELSSYLVDADLIDKLDKADWLSNNSKVVKKNSPDLYEKYKDWNQERCSYTIRFFAKDRDT